MRTIKLLILSLVACVGCAQGPSAARPSPHPTPQGCGAECNSNIQCGQDISRSCPFCNGGSCRSTSPFDPLGTSDLPPGPRTACVAGGD